MGAWDHPRTRREQTGELAICSTPLGSSPHSQGTGSQRYRRISGRRIIPALAGNSYVLSAKFNWRQDHPRTRREQKFLFRVRRHRIGSSPHSQGTVPRNLRIAETVRIIPALAGNSRWNRCSDHCAEDHPRTRREQSSTTTGPYSSSGSSPHSQGTGGREGPPPHSVRIIPALAGNSQHGTGEIRGQPDHPRTRREQRIVRPFNSPHLGSSPHSQGTGQYAQRLRPRGGIIPALAGNRPRLNLR